jgi:squalene-hopene/tetraprenyl-beta-curcumene cyclase
VFRTSLLPAAALAVVGLVGLCTPARANEADLAMYGKSLEWLVSQQHPNGGFGQIPGQPPGEIGITGLVLKGLADAPEPFRTKFRPQAEKAAAFLLQHKQDNGSFSQGRSGLSTYRTSIAITSLAAFDRAKYADVIAKAAEWLKGDQVDDPDGATIDSPHHGGFGYDESGQKPDADMSNTQMALAALHDAGVAPDDPVFQRAMTFITRCQNNSETNDGVGKLKPLEDGGFIYDPGLSRNKSAAVENPDGTKSFVSYASMTYAGLMSLLHGGRSGDDPQVQAALRWIASNYTLEENKGLGVRQTDPAAAQQGLYYYYHSFAKCLSTLGDATVQTDQGERNWARDLFDALHARVKPEGFFQNANDRWWEQDPVLVTAYCISAMNYALPLLPTDGN